MRESLRNLTIVILVYTLFLSLLGCGGTSDSGDNVVKGFNQLRESTFVVAANDATAEFKAGADYQCDGTADQTEVMAAIAAARATGGGEVVLSGGTFTFSAQLLVAYTASDKGQPIKIRGMGDATTIDVSSFATVNGQFYVYGGTTTTTTALTIDGDVGKRAISVTGTSGFAVGDHVLLFSTEAYSTNTLGEIFKIQAISGGSVTLDNKLNDTYTTAYSARLTKTIMVEDLELCDFKLIADSTDVSSSGIRVRYADNLNIHDVTIEDAKYAAIRADNIINSNIHDNRISGTNRVGYGYAISLGLASKLNNIYNNTITDCTKICTVSGGGGVGVTFFTNVTNNVGYDVDHGIETHGEAKYTVIANNIIDGTYGHGIAASDNHVKILDNMIFNVNNNGASGDAAIYGGGVRLTNIEIRGNSVYWQNSGTSGNEYGIRVNYDATNLETVIITDNYIDGFKYPITISRALEGAQITHNVIRNPIIGGLGIEFSHHNSPSKNIIIAHNDIDGDGKLLTGIYVSSLNGGTISAMSIIGNNVRNNTDQGIYLYTTDIEARRIDSVIIKDNFIYDDQPTPTQDHGIEIAGRITDGVIEGNYFDGNTSAAYTYTSGSITGVHFKDNTGYMHIDTTDTANPPTDAQLDAIAGGGPSVVGAGWEIWIDDDGGGANIYRVVSDGTRWLIFTSAIGA